MTTYIQVRWEHEGDDEPVVLYHEIAEDRREVRRVELFKDGRLQRTDRIDLGAPTSLSLEPLPSLEEIRNQPEFFLIEIDRDTFEDVWDQATQGHN